MTPGGRRRGTRQAGFTLLEVVLTVAILTVIALVLVGTVAAAEKMTSLVRERSIALGACRSYVEEMRALSLEQVMGDRRTPADFLPAGFALPGAVGEVWKVNQENGSGAAWVRGTPGSTNSQTAGVDFSADRASLGFPRNLTATTGVTENPPADSALKILPARVRLTWTSGRSETRELTVYAVLGNP